MNSGRIINESADQQTHDSSSIAREANIPDNRAGANTDAAADGAAEVQAIHDVTSAAWTHLDPVARPIAARDDFTRAQHILKDLYVSHPPAQYVEGQIEQLLRLPRRIRMPGLFLCADSGMGKTHILRRIERRHPERENGEGKCIRPVLYVQVPAAPSVRSLRRTLIDEANIPFLDHPERPTPESILRRGLAAAGTQLIVLDEIHNIEHVTWRQRVQLRDWVRCLSNMTQRPIVLAGTQEFECAIQADSQLATRYAIVRLPRWSCGPDFAAFLQGYERACPLRLSSRLSDPRFMRALLDETDGITEFVIRSLQAAALVAIREQTERITIDYLAWWRDPPMLMHYKQDEYELDPAELAAAWLRDQRRDAQPLTAPAGRKPRNRAAISTGEGACHKPL